MGYVKIIQQKEMFEMLYNNSALTFVGLAKNEDVATIIETWLKKHKALTDELTLCYTTGKEMNEYYKLTGTNAYWDKTIITIVDPKCIDLMKIVYPRMEASTIFGITPRWFNDIVDNNKLREETKRSKGRNV